LHLFGDELRDYLGVGLGAELSTLGSEFRAQLGEVLDNPVVHHRDTVGRVRMRVNLVGPTMRRPAGVADADRAVQRLALEAALQVLQLALGALARQHAMLEGRHAGGVVAAIFEPLEGVDQVTGYRFGPQDSDDSTHEMLPRDAAAAQR